MLMRSVLTTIYVTQSPIFSYQSFPSLTFFFSHTDPLPQCPALFGILAEWLHTRHLG